MANKLIKPVKKALAEKYGYKNVSVKNGQGTAWGWVDIHLSINKPKNCNCIENEPYCETCGKLLNEKRLECEHLAVETLKKENLKPYTYYADDGYSTEHNEILTQVSFN